MGVNRLLIFILVAFAVLCKAQSCKEQLKSDSLFKPVEKTKVPVTLLNSTLKNGGYIQLINNNGKFFLKLGLIEKLGLNESGPLEIRSGTKSFFIKNATLYDLKESSPYFLIDVYINYIGTLKDEGITSVVFNTKFEAKLPKEDVSQVRKMAKCFYELNKK